MAVKVDLEKCTGCAHCVDACPMEVIEIKNNKAEVAFNCAECGVCINSCPRGALSL